MSAAIVLSPPPPRPPPPLPPRPLSPLPPRPLAPRPPPPSLHAAGRGCAKWLEAKALLFWLLLQAGVMVRPICSTAALQACSPIAAGPGPSRHDPRRRWAVNVKNACKRQHCFCSLKDLQQGCLKHPKSPCPFPCWPGPCALSTPSKAEHSDQGLAQGALIPLPLRPPEPAAAMARGPDQ